MRFSTHRVVILFVVLLFTGMGHAASVAVIPMHGQLGALLGERERIEEVIDARWLTELLEYCERNDCETLILEIDSLGGYLETRDQLIDTIQSVRKKGTYVVAYVKNALGAATALPLACDEIHVAPQARFGAASLDRGSRWHREASAIDTYESAESAILRGLLTLHNAAPELADALSVRGTELWWDPVAGFGTLPVGTSSRQLTDRNKVLALTATELIEFSIADSMFNSVEELLRDLEDPTLDRIDLESLEKSLRRKRASLFDRLERDQERCRSDLGHLNRLFEAMQKTMNTIEEVARDQRKTSRQRAIDLKALNRTQTRIEREARTTIRSINRFSLQARRTHDNASSAVELDSITTCRIDEIESAVQRDWKRLSQREDVDAAKRAVERVIEQWDECVADAEVLLSRVPR